MIKLAFSGKMRAGKDTCANYLAKRLSLFGVKVQFLAFANTLKSIVANAQNAVGLPQKKDREFLQWLGEHYRRIDPDIWVKALEDRINHLEGKPRTALIVTDLRFDNERKMLLRHDFSIVRVQAKESLRIARGAEPSRLDDISEVALDPYDSLTPATAQWCVVENNASEDMLQRKLDGLFCGIVKAYDL